MDIPEKMNDQDMDDCLGCITFISPETESSKLFSVNMKLEQIVRKVKKLETVLKNIKLDSTILKFKFDHNKQLSTFWSTDEKVSFLLTNRYLRYIYFLESSKIKNYHTVKEFIWILE